MQNLNLLKTQTMTSLEIAKLTGKEHRNVMRDIRDMLKELELPALTFEHGYLDKQNQERPMFKLDKELTLTLVSGYNIKMRHAIIKRWQELESKQIVPPIPLKTPLELLNESVALLNKAEEEKALLQNQLSMIGNHLAGSTIGELGEDMMFNVVAKLLSTNLDINLGQNKLMAILRRKQWLMVGRSVYEHNMPMQSKIKYMRVYIHQDQLTGKMRATTVLRPNGLVALSKKIVKWYIEDINIRRLENNIQNDIEND